MSFFWVYLLQINSFNNQAQGCCSEKISSWTRFKRADDGFEFLSNKNTTIDDKDKKHVSSLREWLKSNPNNPYLLEAGLSDKEIVDFGSWKQEEYRTNSKLFNHYLPNARFVQFSRLGEGYIDIICQVCAVCKDSKDYNFLLVWDGTQTKYSLYSFISSSIHGLNLYKTKDMPYIKKVISKLTPSQI